jgi:hypothetical protein
MKVPNYQPGMQVERQRISAEKNEEIMNRKNEGEGYHKVDTEANKSNRDAFYSDYYAKHPEEASKPGVYPNPNKTKAAEAPADEAVAPAAAATASTQKAAVAAPATAATAATHKAAAPAESKAAAQPKADWEYFAENVAKRNTDFYADLAKMHRSDFDYDKFYAEELAKQRASGEANWNRIVNDKNNPNAADLIKYQWRKNGIGLEGLSEEELAKHAAMGESLKKDWMIMAEYNAKYQTESAAESAKQEGWDFNYDEYYNRQLAHGLEKAEDQWITISVNSPGQAARMKRNWAADGYDVENVPPEPVIADKKTYDGPLEDWEALAVDTAKTAVEERANEATESGQRADLGKLWELALSVIRGKDESFWTSLLGGNSPDAMDTVRREIFSMFGNNQETWLSKPYDAPKSEPYDAQKNQTYDAPKGQPYDAPKSNPYDAPKETAKGVLDSKA